MFYEALECTNKSLQSRAILFLDFEKAYDKANKFLFGGS